MLSQQAVVRVGGPNEMAVSLRSRKRTALIRRAKRTGQSKEEETQRYDVKASVASSKRPRKVRNMSAKALVRALDHIISEEGNVEGTGGHDVMEEDSMLLEGMKPPKFTKPQESTKARQGSEAGQKHTE